MASALAALPAALAELRRDLADQAHAFDLRRQPDAADALRTVAARLAELVEGNDLADPRRAAGMGEPRPCTGTRRREAVRRKRTREVGDGDF